VGLRDCFRGIMEGLWVGGRRLGVGFDGGRGRGEGGEGKKKMDGWMVVIDCLGLWEHPR
jgi:hypothetical protein